MEMRIAPFLCHGGLALALALGVAVPAHANTDDAAGSANVTIASPLQISKTQDLEFGQLIPNGTGVAQATISAQNGNRSANANMTLHGTAGDRATFAVVGEPLSSFQILVAGPVISLSGPGLNLLVDNLRVSADGGAEQPFASTHVIPLGGTLELGVGGRLTAASNQTPGVYSGDFTLIAVHN